MQIKKLSIRCIVNAKIPDIVRQECKPKQPAVIICYTPVLIKLDAPVQAHWSCFIPHIQMCHGILGNCIFIGYPRIRGRPPQMKISEGVVPLSPVNVVNSAFNTFCQVIRAVVVGTGIPAYYIFTVFFIAPGIYGIGCVNIRIIYDRVFILRFICDLPKGGYKIARQNISLGIFEIAVIGQCKGGIQNRIKRKVVWHGHDLVIIVYPPAAVRS